MNELASVLKQTAFNVFENSKPSDYCYGVVVSKNPLKIEIEDKKIILESNQLLLTPQVMNYELPISLVAFTEPCKEEHQHYYLYWSGSGFVPGISYGTTQEHQHLLMGKFAAIVHFGLEVNDSVLLLRKQGGQQFVVLTKIFPSTDDYIENQYGG